MSCRKDCNNSDENQAEEGEREALNRSLADEILDELYGSREAAEDDVELEQKLLTFRVSEEIFMK